MRISTKRANARNRTAAHRKRAATRKKLERLIENMSIEQRQRLFAALRSRYAYQH